MNFKLNSPVFVQENSVAVVCRNTIATHMATRHVAVTGAKHPVAFLFKTAGQVWALNPNGARMTLNELEKLCPGMISQFKIAIAH